MARPVWKRATEIADRENRPVARFEPLDGDNARLELRLPLSGRALNIRLSRRGARVLGFAMIDWAGKGRKQRLWGPGEIIAEYGISGATLKRWRDDHDFPAPAKTLMQGPVWEEPVVRGWVKHRRPRRGAPPLAKNGAGPRTAE